MFNPTLLGHIDTVVKILAILGISLGFIVMLGWIFHIPALAAVFTSYSSMKFNSAISFVLFGFGLLNMKQRRLAQALVLAVLLIGLLSLSQYLFGWQLGIDELFVADIHDQTNLFPGRMSPITALLFALIGLSLLLNLRERYPVFSQLLALSVVFLALLALAGYLYGVQSLYKISSFSSMALHTSLGFIGMGIACFMIRPQEGIAAWIYENRAGGLMARQLLPLVLIIPLILAWLRLKGQEIGLYDTAFGLTLFTLSNLLVLTCLVFWTARSLNRVDRERGQATEALSLLVGELEERVVSRTEELESKMKEEHEFQDYLKALHDVSLELSNLNSMDRFYKRAVEFGLERFGFERLGLLLFDPADEMALGTYGTDRKGKLISEEGLRFNPSELTSILYRAFHRKERFALDENAELYSNYEHIGTGQNAAAVLWNGSERLGWLAIDNAIHLKPIRKSQLDILALYALTLGSLLAQKQGQLALEKSEVRYRSVVTAMSEGIILVDKDGKVQTLNEAAKRIAGLSSEQLMGQDSADPEWYMVYEDGTVVPREGRPTVMSLRTGRAYSNLIMGVHKPDKSLTWVLINTEPMFRDGEAQPYAVVASFSDISQQKLAQQQAFEIALEKERIDILNQFIQNSSHEFRTPLAIMKTSLYFISKSDDAEKRQSKVKLIDDQIARLTKLIDTLLILNRLDIGEQFAYSSQDINTLVQDLCKEMQPQAESKNSSLSLELGENLPGTKIDYSQILRALREIVDNAIRFSPAQSHVKISTTCDEKEIRVLVQDDGTGISPELMPHVFERFYRQDSAHSTPGFGLGLSIAKAIVRQHGGEVLAESRIGEGSIFLVTLPINL